MAFRTDLLDASNSSPQSHLQEMVRDGEGDNGETESQDYALGTVQSRVRYFEAEIEKVSKSMWNGAKSGPELPKNRIKWGRTKRFHFDTFEVAQNQTSQNEALNEKIKESYSHNSLATAKTSGNSCCTDMNQKRVRWASETTFYPPQQNEINSLSQFNETEEEIHSKMEEQRILRTPETFQQSDMEPVKLTGLIKRNVSSNIPVSSGKATMPIPRNREPAVHFDKTLTSASAEQSPASASTPAEDIQQFENLNPVKSIHDILVEVTNVKPSESQQHTKQLDNFNQQKNIKDLFDKLNQKLENTKILEEDVSVEPTRSQQFEPVIADSLNQLKSIEASLDTLSQNQDKMFEKGQDRDEHGPPQQQGNESDELDAEVELENEIDTRRVGTTEIIGDFFGNQNLDKMFGASGSVVEESGKNDEAKEILIIQIQAIDELEAVQTSLDELNQKIDNQVKRRSLISIPGRSKRMELEKEMNPLKNVRDTLSKLNAKWESRKKIIGYGEESSASVETKIEDVKPTKSTHNLGKLKTVLTILDKLNIKFEEKQTPTTTSDSMQEESVDEAHKDKENSENNSSATFLEDLDELKKVETLLEQLDPTSNEHVEDTEISQKDSIAVLENETESSIGESDCSKQQGEMEVPNEPCIEDAIHTQQHSIADLIVEEESKPQEPKGIESLPEVKNPLELLRNLNSEIKNKEMNPINKTVLWQKQQSSSAENLMTGDRKKKVKELVARLNNKMENGAESCPIKQAQSVHEQSRNKMNPSKLDFKMWKNFEAFSQPQIHSRNEKMEATMKSQFERIQSECFQAARLEFEGRRSKGHPELVEMEHDEVGTVEEELNLDSLEDSKTGESKHGVATVENEAQDQDFSEGKGIEVEHDDLETVEEELNPDSLGESKTGESKHGVATVENEAQDQDSSEGKGIEVEHDDLETVEEELNLNILEKSENGVATVENEAEDQDLSAAEEKSDRKPLNLKKISSDADSSFEESVRRNIDVIEEKILDRLTSEDQSDQICWSECSPLIRTTPTTMDELCEQPYPPESESDPPAPPSPPQ